jgi:hypothetical protein
VLFYLIFIPVGGWLAGAIAPKIFLPTRKTQPVGSFHPREAGKNWEKTDNLKPNFCQGFHPGK